MSRRHLHFWHQVWREGRRAIFRCGVCGEMGYSAP